MKLGRMTTKCRACDFSMNPPSGKQVLKDITGTIREIRKWTVS